ncbi:MAG TPA: amidohydrolase family protein, partial [Vicinamibacterales bacterium]|nr:amidohydrolase family protein [Vicinamibacterales bacterium]
MVQGLVVVRSVPLLILASAIVSGPHEPAVRAGTEPSQVDLLIRNVRIVHGDGRVTPRATVLVQSGRIAAVAAGDVRGGPQARREVSGAGRTLIPGLIDAHVHVSDASLPLFLRFGITTVRDLHNAPAYILPLARDDMPGRPRIVAAGALLDGRGSAWPGARIVESVADVRAAVREQVGAGAGVIAVAPRLSAALTDAVVREANARGVPVAVHLGRTTALAAARAGVASVEHAGSVADADAADAWLTNADGEFRWWPPGAREWARPDPARLDEDTRKLRENAVVLVPTLALYEALARRADQTVEQVRLKAEVTAQATGEDVRLKADATEGDPVAVLGRLVARFVRLGGIVAAGSDAALPLVSPGASLHRELQLYVAAGLTPAAALEAATVRAARLLAVADRV